MKKLHLSYVLLLLTSFLSSCELVKGIFKAGVFVGVLAVVVVVGLIFFLISKIFGGGGN